MTSPTRTNESQRLSLADWQAKVREHYSDVEFTVENGEGNTYGELGEWCAHIGPDMQDDVVGVYCPEEFCNVYVPNSDDIIEYETDTTPACSQRVREAIERYTAILSRQLAEKLARMYMADGEPGVHEFSHAPDWLADDDVMADWLESPAAGLGGVPYFVALADVLAADVAEQSTPPIEPHAALAAAIYATITPR